MRAKISKEKRDQIIPEIRTYVAENFEEEIGDLKATLLLDFILERVAPSIYNEAIRHASTFVGEKLLDMEGELHEMEKRRPSS